MEYAGLENFEALMALGNIASSSEAARKRILKESDFVMQVRALNRACKSCTNLNSVITRMFHFFHFYQLSTIHEIELR